MNNTDPLALEFGKALLQINRMKAAEVFENTDVLPPVFY